MPYKIPLPELLGDLSQQVTQPAQPTPPAGISAGGGAMPVPSMSNFPQPAQQIQNPQAQAMPRTIMPEEFKRMALDDVKVIQDAQEKQYYLSAYDDALVQGKTDEEAYGIFKQRFSSYEPGMGGQANLPGSDWATRQLTTGLSAIPGISDNTAATAAGFIVPQKPEDLAVQAVLEAKGAFPLLAKTPLKELPSLLGKLGVEEARQTVFGAAGGTAAYKVADDLGAPDSVKAAAGIVGGGIGGYAGERVYKGIEEAATGGALRGEPSPVGSGFLRPQDETPLDPEVAKLIGLGEAKQAPVGSKYEVIEELTGYKLKNPDTGTMYGDFVSRREANKWAEENPLPANPQDVNAADTMRRAMSGEDLGTATNPLAPILRDKGEAQIDGPSGGSEDDGGFILHNRDGSYEIQLDRTGEDFQFGTLDEAQAWIESRGLKPHLNSDEPHGFIDVDQHLMDSQYAKDTPEKLQGKLEMTTKQIDVEQRKIDAKREDGLMPDTEALDSLVNTQREMQAWMDVKNGTRSQLGDALRITMQRNGGIGGAASAFGLQPLRDIKQVTNEVVVADDALTKFAIARTGLNPALARGTPVGRITTAYQRLLIESEGLASVITNAVFGGAEFVNKNQQGSIAQRVVQNIVQMKDIVPIKNDGSWTLKEKFGGGTTVTVPWQEVFEHPNAFIINTQQRDLIDRFNSTIELTERLREASGLEPRDRNAVAGVVYVPRQVKDIQGVATQRFSNPNVQRSYADIVDSFQQGNHYLGPKETLELHIKAAYREMADNQFTETISKYGIKPNELMPEPTRVERDKAQKAYNQASRDAQLEASAAQRLYNAMFTKDAGKARVQWEAARRNLKRMEGEIAGRNITGGKVANAMHDYQADIDAATAEIATHRTTIDSIKGNTAADEAARTAAEKSHTEAIRREARLKGELAGRSQMGANRAPVSYGPKLKEAQDRIKVSKQTVEDLRGDTKADPKKLAAAQKELSAAQADLAYLRGANSTQTRMARSAVQSPLSLGTRLSAANARVTATEAIYKDALSLSKQVPKGRAGAMRLVSDSTLNRVKAASTDLNKAKSAYTRAMNAVTTSTMAVSSQAYFDKSVVSARETKYTKEKEYKAVAAEAKRNGKSIYTDPQVVSARKDMRTSERYYNSTLSAAKTTFPDKINIQEWRNNWFPQEDVKDIEEGLHRITAAPGAATQALSTIANVRRTISTGFDFGTPFIHGFPTMMKSPKSWAYGTFKHYLAFLDPTVQGKYMSDNVETLQKLARNELTPIGSDLYNLNTSQGGGVSLQFMDKVGLGKLRKGLNIAAAQVYGRFETAYNTGILIWRTELWKSMEKNWKGTEPELAHVIRNLTGGIDTRALGVGSAQRAFEGQWIAMSPRLMRSTAAMISDLRLGPMNPVGRSAMHSVASMVAGTTLLYVITGAALGKSEQDIKDGLNPLNGKRFLAHKIGGQWIGVGGTTRAITQLLAGVYSAAAPKYDTGINLPYVGEVAKTSDSHLSDLWSREAVKNPVLNFFTNRGAPTLDTAASVGEALTGANLVGYEQIDGMTDLAQHLGTSNLPYVVSGHLQGDDLFGSVTNMGGLRTSPETPVEERANIIDLEVIPELTAQGIIKSGAKSADDLGFGEADAVNRYLKEQRPDLVDAYEAWRRRFNSVYQEKQDERDRVDASFKPDFDRLYTDLLSGKMAPSDVINQLSNLRNQLKGSIDQLYSDPTFQKDIKNLPRNQLQTLADDYFAITDKVSGGSRVMTADQWDEVDKQQQKFMQDLQNSNPQLATAFQNDLKLRDSVIDAHPIIKLKREVDTASQVYYDTPQAQRPDMLANNPLLNIQRWVMYGTQLQSPQSVDMVLGRQASGLIGDTIRQSGFAMPVTLAGFSHRIDTDQQAWKRDESLIDIFQQLDPKLSAYALENRANFNAMSLYWGHSDLAHTPDALKLFDSQVEALHWPGWAAAKPWVDIYMQLPETNKDKKDKIHYRAALPEFDAYVSMFEEYMYGKTPQFASSAGRQAYYKITGKDTSKFAVVPPKD